MFDWLRRTTKKQTVPSDSGLEQLRYLQTQHKVLKAEELVFAFADVMAEHSEWILDARLLPASKRRIAQAFNMLIEHYERLRETDNVKFDSRGGEEFLDQMRALRFRITDFQEIDPEDRELVARINADAGFKNLDNRLADERLRPAEKAAAEKYMRKALMLFHKYHRRAMHEASIVLAPERE